MRRHLPTLIEFGPLVGFFVGFKLGGLMVATVALIGLTLVALALSYWLHRRIAITPLISALAAAIFGSLTLLLHDELFIKMKPTLVNVLFAVVLLGGLARRKGLLKYVMGMAIELSEQGWRTLSRNYAFFFLFLAALNEWVWRHVPTETWVSFKVFGILGLTLVFTVSQLMLAQRYLLPEAVVPGDDSGA